MSFVRYKIFENTHTHESVCFAFSGSLNFEEREREREIDSHIDSGRGRQSINWQRNRTVNFSSVVSTFEESLKISSIRTSG